jgi:hypothetical protein
VNLGILALLGVLVVWAVYRLERWNVRRAVLEGLTYELSVHNRWVGEGKECAKDMTGNWKEKTYLVHRLGTLAIDDAIVRGPEILLNRQLRINLVVYRQVLTHFNQLIDQAMAFQAIPELWVAKPSPDIEKHMLQLIEAVHIAGIGASAEEENRAAHWFFMQVVPELEREAKLGAWARIWGVTGFDLRFLGRWLESLGKWGPVSWVRTKLMRLYVDVKGFRRQ